VTTGPVQSIRENTFIHSQIAETNWLCHPETNIAYERWGVNLFGFNVSFCLLPTSFGDII